MQDFPTHVDCSADVGPSTQLADGQHVAGLEDDIGVRFASHCASDRNFAVLKPHAITVDYDVTGEIGGLRVGTAFEASRHFEQVPSGHAFRKGILTRSKHFTVDGNLGRISLVASEDADGIERLETG